MIRAGCLALALGLAPVTAASAPAAEGASLWLAQARPAQRPAQPQPPPPEPPPPLYEPDLLKLAEIIGSLAVLRELCAGAEAREWPARMAEILAAEGTTDARRARLAGAYNRGLASFATTYRRCTEGARAAEARLTREGDALTRRLINRFGG
jgi:uncharacterized protein (TIGR02301 family)